MMRKLVSMRQALQDADYFGGLLSGDSWHSWRVLLTAVVGEGLTADERVIFKELTGRDREPGEAVESFTGIIGRRGGKSRACAILGAYIAACCDHRAILAPGERGVLPIMAASTVQAAQAFNFISGVFESSPNLRPLVESATSDTISLSTSVDIQVRPASFRTIRGVTAVAAICDETAFWRDDSSANPDRAIFQALRPALATSGGPLICISTPYGRSGELWATFKRHHGPNGHKLILVAKASSKTMNPSLSDQFIARSYEEDPASAVSELGGEFRTDVQALLTAEAVDACVASGVRERPRLAEGRHICAIDAAGGSGTDSMTLCIAHREGDVAFVDCLRERVPPFSPEDCVSEFAAVIKSYGVTRATADRWGGEFVRELFQKKGITVEPAEKSKSDYYRDLVPIVNSKRIELLDHPRTIAQLVGLERRTARGGRDSIDHSPGGHDDCCNSVAIVASMLVKGNYDSTYSWLGGLRDFTNQLTGGSADERMQINSASFGRQFWPRP